MSRSRLARGYFAVQAIAVAAWWLALWLRPEWRGAFKPYSTPDVILLGFAPADLLLLGLASALVAASGRHTRRRRALAWLVAGATIYATLYTLTLALLGSAPLLGALLMIPAAVAAVIAALILDDDVSTVSPGGAR